MRLLRRGAQIEARLAEAWRTHGAYRNARELIHAAVVEDQFAATTRPHRGVTVMTIHKAKGLQFSTVIVPGLDRAPRAGDSPLFRWKARSDGALLMAPVF